MEIQINILDLLYEAKQLTEDSTNLEYNRAICELISNVSRRDSSIRETVKLVASLLDIDSGVP